MVSHHDGHRSAGRNNGTIQSEPVLWLQAGGLNRLRYKDLEPGDVYYSTAAFAYQIQGSLSRTDKQALFVALAADWPRETRGRPAIGEEMHLQAFELHDAGRSYQQIADELGIAEDVARRYVRRGHILRFNLWVSTFAAAAGSDVELEIVGPDGSDLAITDDEVRYWRIRER